ncbi:MAG TPA: hypothetical protein VGL99_16985 [Chloroflexota bacterium]
MSRCTCGEKGSGKCDEHRGASLSKRLWLLVLLAWLVWLVWALARLCRATSRDPKHRPGDGTVPPWAYRQPDPLIYSQAYLQAQGLAVTWHNPDIHIERASAPGVAVDSSALDPATHYVVVARIWNASTTAAAVDLPVKLSYLSFGIGTQRHDVGMTTVDLSVKGGSACPVFARLPWHTPPTPGHYCLQVELIWDDDANPGNNMGQHNTNVRPLNSPHAAFTFPVRNEAGDRRVLRLEADAYQIPPQEPCPPPASAQEAERQRRAQLARHQRAAWPIPAGWQVTVDPAQAALGAGEATEVTVDITAPDGFRGRQVVNVHAFDGQRIVGGVTLYVDGAG